MAGTYVRGLLRFQGYPSGLEYFNRCSPSHSRYKVLLPEFLFGLYENQFYSECIQFYQSLCDQLHWRSVHSIFPGTETAYYHRQKGIKVLQHSRVYGAVIGSALALDNVIYADQLMSEMNFWNIQPLRETYYDYLNVCVSGWIDDERINTVNDQLMKMIWLIDPFICSIVIVAILTKQSTLPIYSRLTIIMSL